LSQRRSFRWYCLPHPYGHRRGFERPRLSLEAFSLLRGRNDLGVRENLEEFQPIRAIHE
jgi:hypothetical protein